MVGSGVLGDIKNFGSNSGICPNFRDSSRHGIRDATVRIHPWPHLVPRGCRHDGSIPPIVNKSRREQRSDELPRSHVQESREDGLRPRLSHAVCVSLLQYVRTKQFMV